MKRHARTFRTGDIVELRTGGPRMQVDFTKPKPKDGRIPCVWSSDRKRVCIKTFAPETIKKVDGPDGGPVVRIVGIDLDEI